MIWLLRYTFLISLFGAAISMVFFSITLKGDKKVVHFVSTCFMVICLALVFSSITFDSSSTSRTSIIISKPVGFVKENTASNQIVWGCNEDQYFKDSHDCEIIIVGDDILKNLGCPTLPYLQVSRVETYESITAFGKTFYDEPYYRDIYRFYVGKEYLDDSALDWRLLFETEGS